MGFWKVLAGAATGVAAVVALPIAGPVGAITAVGAAVAGATGAAGGAIADALDDSEERAEKRGRQKATAEYEAKLAKIKEVFEKWAKDWHRYGNHVVAVTAVGLACANCDGEIHEDELKDIKEFVSGITQSSLPEVVKEQIENLHQKPPSLTTAHRLAKKAGVDFEFLDSVIKVVMHADNRIHPGEQAFLVAWQKLCA